MPSRLGLGGLGGYTCALCKHVLYGLRTEGTGVGEMKGRHGTLLAG